MEIGEIAGEFQMAWANGSRERENNNGMREQPCLDPLKPANAGELVLSVKLLLGCCIEPTKKATLDGQRPLLHPALRPQITLSVARRGFMKPVWSL